MRKPLLPHKYIHVDNGGFTFELIAGDDQTYFLEMSNSFFGYAENKLSTGILASKSLQEIGLWFIEAAKEAEKLEKKAG